MQIFMRKKGRLGAAHKNEKAQRTALVDMRVRQDVYGRCQRPAGVFVPQQKVHGAGAARKQGLAFNANGAAKTNERTDS